jgi:hypothetical protein
MPPAGTSGLLPSHGPRQMGVYDPHGHFEMVVLLHGARISEIIIKFPKSLSPARCQCFGGCRREHARQTTAL